MTQIKIIGAIMFFAGVRPEMFAKQHGETSQTVYRVIKGELQTERVRRMISESVNIPIDVLWPEDK